MNLRKITGPGDIQSARMQELLGERGPKKNQAVRFGDFDSLIGDALKVAKATAIEEAKRAAQAARSIYGNTTFAVSDVLVGNTRTQSNPLTILSETVAGFEDGGFVAAFEGYFDNMHVSRSFGDLAMLVNGVVVSRTRIGARFSDPAEGIGMMASFSLSSVFSTAAATPSIQIRAFAFNADDISTATAGFYVRSGRLIVSGAQ